MKNYRILDFTSGESFLLHLSIGMGMIILGIDLFLFSAQTAQFIFLTSTPTFWTKLLTFVAGTICIVFVISLLDLLIRQILRLFSKKRTAVYKGIIPKPKRWSKTGNPKGKPLSLRKRVNL